MSDETRNRELLDRIERGIYDREGSGGASVFLSVRELAGDLYGPELVKELADMFEAGEFTITAIEIERAR